MTQNPWLHGAGRTRPVPRGLPPPGADSLRRQPLYAADRELAGVALHDVQGELLGHVDEVVVDMAVGRVAYALLPWGGFMGLGERLLVLPWAALSRSDAGQRLRMTVRRERLDDAPSLAPAEALPPPHSDWHRAVHRHFGVQPYWV